MLSVPRYHKTINQETQRPPHLDAGTEDHMLTLQYEQAGLLDKSHNADQRHGPSDTCQCVIATGVLLELEWLWM